MADAREQMVHHLQQIARMSMLHTIRCVYTAAHERSLDADGLLDVP